VQAELLPAEPAVIAPPVRMAEPISTPLETEAQTALPVMSSAPAPASEPAAAAVAMAQVAPVPAPVVANVPELPPVSMTLPPDSGLELVETRSKPAPVAEEAPALIARRVRPPRVPLADEPLQIIETQKEPTPAP
jgi:hypothetical protein